MHKPVPVIVQWLAIIDDDVVPLGQCRDADAATLKAEELAGPDGFIEALWPPEAVAELIEFWAEHGVRTIH